MYGEITKLGNWLPWVLFVPLIFAREKRIRTARARIPEGRGVKKENGVMKQRIRTMGRPVAMLLAAAFLAAALSQDPAPLDLAKFSEPYLGQKPPGTTPELFDFPSLFGGPVFSPGGNELIFRDPSGWPRLVVSRLENGRWTEPRAAGFSGGDLNYSPDGRKLFFASNDPLQKDVPLFDHLDLWVVQRTGTGWSEPANLGPPVNSDQHECWASMAEKGNLYFFRSAGGGKARTVPGGVMVGPAPSGKPGVMDIYCSKFVDGRYEAPEKLGPEVNSDSADLDPAIAPDESCLVFQSNRPGGFGQMDLYISFRNRDGSWTPAVNLGDKINSAGSEFSGRVSADGKYLFFNKANPQTRTSGQYWVSTEIFEQLRKTAARPEEVHHIIMLPIPKKCPGVRASRIQFLPLR